MSTNYKLTLQSLYIQSKQTDREVDSKTEFVGEDIFDFVTYDANVTEMLANKMLEVINVILNKSNSQYQENPQNYLTYLMMVNMPFLKDKLDWGTSIRGAFFDEYGHHSDKEDFYRITPELNVPKKEIKHFLSQLILWVKEGETR